MDHDDTWPCIYCRANNPDDGPPQCGCGEMKPGYECCSWCESYGPISTFKWDGKDAICPTCVALRQRNTGLPLYLGFGVFIIVVIVLWAIWVVVG